MTFPRARLVVSACLFLGWISFLFYLVAQSPSAIVSRPQFLLASLWVVADIREDAGRPEPQVGLDEILWSADSADQALAGRSIAISELAGYRQQQGFQGAGKYLIPLIKEPAGKTAEYIVAAIPRADYYPHPVPTLGTVELLKPGENPGQTVQALIRFAGWNKADGESALARLEKHLLPYLTAARRLPLRDAYELKRELTTAGAQVTVREETVKIYPLTPQTREQVEEFIPAKR